jgi:hypothetical protein
VAGRRGHAFGAGCLRRRPGSCAGAALGILPSRSHWTFLVGHSLLLLLPGRGIVPCGPGLAVGGILPRAPVILGADHFRPAPVGAGVGWSCRVHRRGRRVCTPAGFGGCCPSSGALGLGRAFGVLGGAGGPAAAVAASSRALPVRVFRQSAEWRGPTCDWCAAWPRRAHQVAGWAAVPGVRPGRDGMGAAWRRRGVRPGRVPRWCREILKFGGHGAKFFLVLDSRTC